MTTSGVISSTLTVREALTRAFRQAKILSGNETPTSDELTDGMTTLNLMLKSWQSDGCGIWRELSDSFSTSTAQTTLDPRVMDVMEARLTVSGVDRPLARWEWGDYVNTPNKAATGTPCVYVFRKGRDDVSLFLWPVPSTAMTISYTAARVIEDITTPDETLDVPQEWLECVVTNMAVRLAEEFGSDIPGTVVQRAETLLNQMRDLDRPASIFMGAC